MNPSGKGTAILRNELIEDGVKSVSFKENIKVINIFSMKMINTSGFLRRVFEIFSESKVSVDLISTSEANISVTVDASEKVDAVVAQLSEFAEVIVDEDKSQVSVIGKNIVRLNGMLKKTLSIFSEASTVTEILASEVLMRSTDTLLSLKISNTRRRKPDVLIIFIEKMLITLIFSLNDTDFTPSSMSSLRRIAVPFPEGFIELST